MQKNFRLNVTWLLDWRSELLP